MESKMKKVEHLIKEVYPGSIAEELERSALWREPCRSF